MPNTRFKSIGRLVLGILLATALASCEWFRHSSPSTDPTTAWYIDQSGYAYAKPALVGDTLYIATGDGRVIARNAVTGAQLWSTKVATTRIWGRTILAVGGAIVVPIYSSTVGLDRHTGQLLWTYQAPPDSADGGPTSPGTVVTARMDSRDSNVFVPAWGGSVAAIDARTGAMQWQWRAPPLPHRFGVNGVTVDGATVYLSVWHFTNASSTTCEGRLVAVDAGTGAEKWHTVLPYAGEGVCLPGRPAVTSAVVAVLTVSGEVIALDKTTGAHKWTAARDNGGPNDPFAATIASALVAHDTIIADAGTFHLRALAGASGTVLWKTAYTAQMNNDMTLSLTRIYAPDGSALHVFDRRTGGAFADIFQPGQGFNGLFSASVVVDSARVYAPVSGATWAFQQPGR